MLLKFAKTLSHLVCDALFLLEIPMPTKRLREDWFHFGWWWCTHVHSELETRHYHKHGE